jgi:FkbM family methyltransferase
VDQTRLLGVMERVAHRLRQAGLGRAVSAVRRRLETRFVPSWTDVDGLQMTGRTIGHVDHLRAWQRGDEEAHMTALFKQAVQPGDTVLDVGGYLGWFTLLAARAVGPTGRVIVIEANPQSQGLLERNIERNGFSDRVTIHRTAVADKPGTATFYWDASDGSASGLAAPDNVGGTYVVPVATIDSLLGAEPDPDVAKIDIEGGEVAALAGMRETLAGAKPGMKLFVELNPGALENAGASGDALLAVLRNFGFRINVIDEAARSLRPLGDGERLEQHANLYCERAA